MKQNWKATLVFAVLFVGAAIYGIIQENNKTDKTNRGVNAANKYLGPIEDSRVDAERKLKARE